jgi:peptide/nickel transport system substrate-binding protein
VKKLLFISLTVILAIGLVLGGCAKEEAPAPAAPAPAKPAPAAPAPVAPAPAAPAPAAPAPAKPAPPPAPKGPTGTLRATAPSWQETMDPNLQTTQEYAIYEHLIGIDVKGNFIPELAESWSVSGDGLVWTFKIRKGIKFHNGDDLTSADVKFSLERIKREGSMSPWKPEYSATIDRVETPDNNTVEIYCKKVNYMFYTSIWGCPIVPKNYIEKNGDKYFNEHPIGTAPWKFVKLTPGVSFEFEAVPDHWRITPAFAKLIVTLVPESSTALAALRHGETDIVAVNMDDALKVRDEGYELRILGRPTTPVICMLGTWASKGPLSDVRVREALSLAINRQEIANTFFSGLAEPGGVIWTAPSSWGYDPAWTKSSYFGYDPVKAKALLAEAGYPSKFENPEITIYSHPTQAWLPDLHLIMSGYWEAIGVKTKVVPIDGGQLRGMMYGAKEPSLYGAACIWNMPTMQVSVPFLLSAIHSGGNWQLLHDPTWDALWASISLSPDQDTQIKLFRQTMESLFSKYVILGIANIYTYYAVSDKIGDWTLRFQYDLWGGFAGIKKK